MKTLRSNSRGSALLEAIPVTMLLLVFVIGVLSAGYVLFARTWIHFQSEQTLYCLAEQKRGCRERLRVRVERFLPWGKIGELNVQRGSDRWRVEVLWNFGGNGWRTRKELTLRQILSNRGLRW